MDTKKEPVKPSLPFLSEDYLLLTTALYELGYVTEEDLKRVQVEGKNLWAKEKLRRKGERSPTVYEFLANLPLHRPSDGNPYSLEDLLRLIGEMKGYPFQRIDPLKVDPKIATGIISRPYAERHLLLPIGKEGDILIVATARPLDEEGLQTFQSSWRKGIRFVVTLPEDVERLIRDLYGFRTSVSQANALISRPSVDISNFEQLTRIRGEKELEGSEQHIINAVDYLFRYAFELKASDIHMEPKRDEALIRFRIDGILHPMFTIPRPVHMAMVSRIKLLARMDIAEKRRPQDGRIKTIFQDQTVEIRVSTLPVAFGEKMVLRIFDPTLASTDLSRLGFRTEDRKIFERWIEEPHGIILITGPTGSGKSTTLYTALLRLSSKPVNIVTIEDPIEMVYEAFNQVAVQPQIGITFGSALRTILRQDPDIIMVGEIRDRETAQNAVQAALTGHLVLSTLHTNDAPSAIPRLLDLGVEPFLLSSSLVGVMAQRLVRKVCPYCAEERVYPVSFLAPLKVPLPEGETVILLYGKGCPQCRQTGYLGRTAITEVMDITPSLRNFIQNRAPAQILREQARKEGMRTLRESGLHWILEGITTLEEVLRVTGEEEVELKEEGEFSPVGE